MTNISAALGLCSGALNLLMTKGHLKRDELGRVEREAPPVLVLDKAKDIHSLTTSYFRSCWTCFAASSRALAGVARPYSASTTALATVSEICG